MTKTPRPLPILDWKSSHDPRSREFPIRAVIGEHVEPRVRRWKPGIVLDQGREGACVGFGWTGELLAAPRRSETEVSAAQGNEFALAIYRRAQLLDEWPGEEYSGTSVLAGAKALMEKGLIESYRWAFGIDDVRDAIIAEGPVVIGIPWYESMYETTPEGQVVVDGDQVGGHCILLTGYHPAHPDFGGRPMFRWRNSWGTEYGIHGHAWIDEDVLAALLDDGGEACVPLGRRAVTLSP